jgi:hypothetical protein
MKDNNALVYGAIVVVAVLVIVGAYIAVSVLAPPSYDIGLALSANNVGGVVYPYQSTVFNIIVTNNGGRPVVGLPVAFYVNGAQRNYSTFAIPAHQSVALQEVYTYLQPGSYLFSAAADPGNVLPITNASAARNSIVIATALPEPASVYSSVPNSNIVSTESFTSSGTGLLSGSLMSYLYNISAIGGINGLDNGILAKTYQDLYQYVAVANGAYSLYSNGTASYSAWLQGSLYPQAVAAVVSSFGKQVSPVNSAMGTVEFAALSNTVSLCSYYDSGWTKIIEFYNASNGESCASFVGKTYTDLESNAIVAALKTSRLGKFTASNQVNSSQISWQHFYYNNATVLGQSVEYSGNSVAASTLFELQSPQGIFLSSIRNVATNVLAANNICFGLESDVNRTSVCSVALPTTAKLGNQTFGAVYSSYISSNYTAAVYSLLSEAYLTEAHGNAAELISKLGINGSQVIWTSPFKNSCEFDSGFGCRINRFGANSTVNITVTDLNYTSVSLTNVTCAIGGGFPAEALNTTLSRGANTSITTVCHVIPVSLFAGQDSFILSLGFKYRNTPMIVNGTLNATTSG